MMNAIFRKPCRKYRKKKRGLSYTIKTILHLQFPLRDYGYCSAPLLQTNLHCPRHRRLALGKSDSMRAA